ncbi:MAG: TIGR04076 family protein [Chloroflexi bacterium]|nr:TIGR04076 family protein [Chloroflexota bacterium]
MSKVKITVLKRMVNEDIIDEYIGDEQERVPCGLFEDGQEFIQEDWRPPEGFCPWVWADIHKEIILIRRGGEQGGRVPKGTAITCCTDGFRPVVFKIERIE